MSIIAMLAAATLGTCSVNQLPPVRCQMVYNISAERLVGVGWALDSEHSLVLVGPQVSTTRMEVQAISINQSEAYLISGYCTVSTTIACTYNIGPKTYTFTFVED